MKIWKLCYVNVVTNKSRGGRGVSSTAMRVSLITHNSKRGPKIFSICRVVVFLPVSNCFKSYVLVRASLYKQLCAYAPRMIILSYLPRSLVISFALHFFASLSRFCLASLPRTIFLYPLTPCNYIDQHIMQNTFG